MRTRRFPDEGYTLVEVVVSLAVAGVLLGSIGTFVVNGMGSTRQQGREQTAVQLALDGMELARTLRGATLIEGRAVCAGACPSAAATGAATHVQNTRRYDVASSPAVPPTLPLPGTPEHLTVDGVRFARHYYVGRCWTAAAGGACTGAPTATAVVPFFRVTVAVTWPQQTCGSAGCNYVTSTLFAAHQADPVFRP